MTKNAELFQIGKRYSFVWDDGSGGRDYDYGTVTAQNGTVISVDLEGNKKPSVFNTATPSFVLAELQA